MKQQSASATKSIFAKIAVLLGSLCSGILGTILIQIFHRKER